MADVVSMLEDDDFQTADIFILPPEDATRSDEDSGPEDDDGHIDNLSGNQLCATAEATVTTAGFNRKRIGVYRESDDECKADNEVESDDISESPGMQLKVKFSTWAKKTKRPAADVAVAGNSVQSKRQRGSMDKGTRNAEIPEAVTRVVKTKTAPPSRQWVKRDLKQPDVPWNVNSEIEFDHTPSSLFELFFDDDVIRHITDMTNLYAIQKSKQLGATTSDIRLVIAILLISGMSL